MNPKTFACYAAAVAFSAFAAVLSPISASAEVRLPDIVGDNMVLQQNTQANLWGWAAPRSEVKVTVSWSDAVYSCTADKEGRWKIPVATPEASYDAQTITISDKDGSVSLGNILIGEVWFCSGQSNMEMPLTGFWNCPVEGSAETITTAGKWPYIHVATVPKNPSLTPLEEAPGKWYVSAPENAGAFSAVGYHFAQMLQAALDVPVGIINCSWGGASVEGWSSEQTLSAYPDIDVKKTFDGFVAPEQPWEWSYRLPMIMFNGMFMPLHHYTVKGILWYQGESNVGKHDTYPQRLANMVAEWRSLFGQGDIPFYFVELAPYINGGDGTSGARFRECQQQAVSLIPNSGLVCTNDLVFPYEYDQIHPAKKKEVGERLAYLALNKTYGYWMLACSGPVYKSMSVSDGKVIVEFDNIDEGLSPWRDLQGFELAGEDRVFHPATACIRGEDRTVIVSSEEVPQPVAVRYCFRDFQIGNLTGARNLPAFPFRSDNW